MKNYLDTDYLGLQLEDIARKAVPAIAFAFTVGLTVGNACRSFLNSIEPPTPNFYGPTSN